jgi:hypothetical protein
MNIRINFEPKSTRIYGYAYLSPPEFVVQLLEMIVDSFPSCSLRGARGSDGLGFAQGL